jgi:hypothetical protein
MEIDLDQLTQDVIDAFHHRGLEPPDGRGTWERIFYVLKVALRQPNAVPPMLRAVAAAQTEANTGDRAVVQSQAATARTDDAAAALSAPTSIVDGSKIVRPSVFEILTETQRRRLIEAVHSLAIGTDDADEQIGPFVRGFFHGTSGR